MRAATGQTVSIVIPCHNEEAGLRQLRDRLVETLPRLEDADQYCFQVLLFDNGSTDSTFETMRALFDGRQGFVLHHHPTNIGIGGSLRAALPLVSGQIIVGMDSDCTYDPECIERLLAPLREGWDVATGSPYHPEGKVLWVPAWRLLLSRGLSRIYRCVGPLKLWTYTSMFRAYRRPVLEAISWRSDGFLSTSEILMEAAATGFTVCEVPMTLSVRHFGASKLRLFSVVVGHLRYLTRLVCDTGLRRRLRKNFQAFPAGIAHSAAYDPERG